MPNDFQSKMDERVVRETFTGMSVAKLSFVQVQLTTFETENFPLVIQDNREIAMISNDISVEVQPVSTGKSKVTVAIGKSARLDRKTDQKIFRSAGSVIGANTLSIIGQIEPGRTVRLYRQIH